MPRISQVVHKQGKSDVQERIPMSMAFFSSFSILYFTSIYNVHLEIYNSSINNMITH